MRLTAMIIPRTTPYFSTACKAYSEHVGTNRQVGGFNGEINLR